MVVSVDIMTSGLFLNEEFLNGGGIFVSDQVGFRYDGGTVLKIDETIGAEKSKFISCGSIRWNTATSCLRYRRC